MTSGKQIEALVLVPGIAAAGCGARSELVSSGAASSGADGGGGRDATASSTSSTGGSGGGPVVESCKFSGGGIGGAPVAKACGALQARPEFLTFGAEGEDDDQPSLVLVADAAPGVAAVFASRTSAGDGAANAKVALFDGWGSWPASVASEATVANRGAPIVGDDFSAVAHVGHADRELMLAYSSHGKAQYALEVSACDGKTHPGLLMAGESHDRIQAGTRGTPIGVVASNDFGTLLAGVLSRKNGVYLLGGAAGEFGPTSVDSVSGMFACSTTPIPFSAIPVASGWIVGVASGAPSGSDRITCDESRGPAGPSKFVIFGFVGEPTPPPQTQCNARPTDTLPTASTVEHLVLAPAGDGARAIWSEEGHAELFTAALDAGAHVTARGTLDLGVAVDRKNVATVGLGRGFAVVAPTTASSIHAVAFDESGMQVGAADLPSSGVIDGRPRALAARDGSALLVTWAERPSGGGGRVVRVARFDCLAP